MASGKTAIENTNTADDHALASAWGDLIEECEERADGWYYPLADGVRVVRVGRDGAVGLVQADDDPEARRRAQSREKSRRYRERHRDRLAVAQAAHLPARRAAYAARREAINALRRERRAVRREAINAAKRRYYAAHREENLPRRRDYRATHRERVNALKRDGYARPRLADLQAVGGKEPRCACCGANDPRALVVADPTRDGRESYRKQLPGVPPATEPAAALVVRCRNCAFALGRYGVCGCAEAGLGLPGDTRGSTAPPHLARWIRQQKHRALAAYSDPPGTPRCAHCGSTAFVFLTLVGVEAGDREGQGRRRPTEWRCRFYARLRREGWPDGHRVLCRNCREVARHAELQRETATKEAA